MLQGVQLAREEREKSEQTGIADLFREADQEVTSNRTRTTKEAFDKGSRLGAQAAKSGDSALGLRAKKHPERGTMAQRS